MKLPVFSSFAVVLFVLALILCQTCTTMAMSRLTARELDGELPYLPVRRAICVNYMSSCIPWEAPCCGKMACLNMARGYCLYPLEKCRCHKKDAFIY